MKNKMRLLRASLATCLLISIALATPLRAAELSAVDKQFLITYEKLHAALAADDLAAAKKAGTELGDEGKAIAAATDLKSARTAFGQVSERAVTLAEGQEGYYVAKCPMVKKSWVQTSTEIKNPYYGKEMVTCGVIKE